MSRAFAAVLAAILFVSQPPAGPAARVTIRVDASAREGPMKPVWAFFGYDEPNYTYMKDGRKLLSELAELSPVPVYVRTHNLLTTGDGSPALKWGSTNAYTEDAQGQPQYDWTIVDRILDTYLQRGMKPLVEIGFMPAALSVAPEPYRHRWAPGDRYTTVFTGWAHPPADYDKWRELVSRWVRHSVEKYGRAEVDSWWWEVWNEPDIGYWQGTPEEYFKLYDYATDGLKRALPSARIGGPHSTGPGDARAETFLRRFLDHCVSGRNYATGKTGSPIDYVGFHAKGAPRMTEDGHVRMGIANQLTSIAKGFATVRSFPTLKSLPIVIGESDPEGCAACPARAYPQNAYRNGTMYSSYTAEQIARTYQLARLHEVNLLGTVTWAFEFEDQPYFDGFRDLSTNGIDKPVMNVFRMLGQMRGDFVSVESSGALSLDTVRENGVRQQPDINAIATRNERSVWVLVWNYHDDDLAAPGADVDLAVEHVADGAVSVTHARVDADHSNAYEAWKRMGAPQTPSPDQYARLEQAGRLAQIGPSQRLAASDGRVRLAFALPRQAVSLITITW
jgi:xylan 1,4-beta-xylosidase